MARANVRHHFIPFALLLSFSLGPLQATGEASNLVRPGSPSEWQDGNLIAGTCPTFSWGAVAGDLI
jgi:hypothetical protein